jgi:hypothetical protein
MEHIKKNIKKKRNIHVYNKNYFKKKIYKN